jgi:hypothetical protein
MLEQFREADFVIVVASPAYRRFPLREGVMVTLCLPTDLTVAEAARHSAFITALPMQPDDASEALRP